MKRILSKNMFFGILIGIVITSGISVYAVNIIYTSNQISYTGSKPEINNVQLALDDLYNIAAVSGGSLTELAKDTSGNLAQFHYYGARIASATKTFTLNKGKYTLFMFTTYNDIYSSTAIGGDTTASCTVSGGTITKINEYCYIVDIPTDGTDVNVTINSYGDNEDRRTIYGIYFYQ